MESARDQLCRKGYMAFAADRYLVIRYRQVDDLGCRRDRVIYVGADEVLMQRAEELLRTWQSERYPERSPDPNKREAWRLAMREAGQLGPYERRRFIGHCRAAAANPVELLLAVKGWTGTPGKRDLSRRGGRPRRASLTWETTAPIDAAVGAS